MNSNLADAFGRGSRPGKAPVDRGRAAPPTPTPSRRQADEKLIAAGVWLPSSLRTRLNAHCKQARLSQAEVILRAVDYASDHLDQLVDTPEPEPVVEEIGGLFPRTTQAAERDTGRNLSVRFRSDHLATLTRIAAHQGMSRSILIKLSLIDYFDNSPQA